MWESIFIPFGVIFLAELFDKSQLSILLLSSKTKNYVALILGAFIAFLLVDGIAIFLGAKLTEFIPLSWLKIASAIIFILYGIKSLLEKENSKPKIGKIGSIFFVTFSMIFLSEWGDKTQLASAVFATKYNPILVLIGVLGALMTIAISTILLSNFISTKVRPARISQIAGVVFILLGISFFIFP